MHVDIGMNIGILISFFFATPPHNTCTTQGVPLFEMRQRSEIDRPETTTKIFESGAWTVESEGNVERGCFDKKELRSIRSAVASAPFEVTSSPIACFAYDPNFTEYLVRGRLRFTERMCSGKAADSETQEALALVKQELADEHNALPQPPPVARCNVEGTPIFEIRKLTKDAVVSTTAIYKSGAWTFEVGAKGALTTGCFDKQTTASLKRVIKQSSWETSYLRMVCRAYSPNATEYYVNGQREYTAKLCGPERLDAKSLGAIKVIEDELAKVLPVAKRLPRLGIDNATAL